MKKFLRFMLLVLALIIAVSINASAQGTLSKNTALKYIDVLKSLEIVKSDYDSTSLDESQKVTRADFAIYLTKMMNFDVYDQDTLYYNDVPKTHYAYNEITYLTERMLMSGTGDKRFEPDSVMKKEYAYAVLLRSLGYQDYMINGTYTEKAYDVGIAKNVSTSEDLLLSDLFVMMYNTLMCDTIAIDSFSMANSTYKECNTLLYEIHDMVYERGKFMTAADGASLLGENVSIQDVVIDGNTYTTEIDDIFEYLGYRVNFIYEEVDDENKIVWIERIETSDVITIEMNEDSYFDASNWRIEYYEGTRRKSFKLTQNIGVVYNGRFVAKDISEIFSKGRYHATLIRYNSSDYNYAIVESYENVMVEYKNDTEETVYDSISDTFINMSSDDYDSFKLLDTNGNELKFDDIKEDCIISVFCSHDKKYFKAVVSNKVVSGNISDISDDYGIAIDGKYYKFYDENASIMDGMIKSATLYLDCQGYVAYADKRFLGNKQFVAYVYRVTTNGDEGLNFKILNENGKLERYQSSFKLKIDGVKYTDEEALEQFTKQRDGSFKPQIMVLSLNKDGIITSVTRASDEGGTSNVLVKNKELPNVPGKPWYAYARVSQGIIGINVLFDDNTKVFKVPADEKVKDAEDTQFSVGKPADRQNFSGAVTYKVTDDDIFYEQYIVLKQASTVNIDKIAQFFVVNKFKPKINEDQEVVTAVSGLLGGIEVEYELDFSYGMDQEILNAKAGDIYIVGINNNKIASYKKVYDNSPENILLEFYSNTNEPKDYGEAESRYYLGFVKGRDGTALKIDYENDGVVDQMADLKSGANTIMVYDSDARPNLYKGSVSDIMHGSKIIVNTTYNSNISIVVYK